MKFTTLCLTTLSAFALASCSDDVPTQSSIFHPDEEAIIAEEFSEDFLYAPEYSDPAELPVHFRSFGFGTLAAQEKWEVHLGRALFYDIRLSEDMSVSCASCHKQSNGFADDKAFSDGIAGRSTSRNSQSINNIRAYYGDSGSGFFWDARATSLQDQATQTMANPNEMGMSLQEVYARVMAVPAYEIFFNRVYRDVAITPDHITRALAAFTRSISSTGSAFDVALDAHMTNSNQSFGFGEELVRPAFSSFTAAQNAGKELYLDNCASCHSTQLPTRLSPQNNGLYATGAYPDKGVGALQTSTNKDGWFKTPQLRNVALTGPYMHDGSIETLREVIDHYSDGIELHKDLSQELVGLEIQPSGKRGFNFSETEKDNLEAFLHTLTDTRLVADTKLSDPFQ